jgi:Uma2 family endonuclease
MTWNEIVTEPSLQNLPFKIETNEWGQIVMSPATNKHSRFQGRILVLLSKLVADGEVMPECSIETSKGVKVADVVWASTQFLSTFGDQTPYIVAPEICLEVRSPSNSTLEINAKIDLYLAKGAKEVWICDEYGKLEYFSHAGKLEKSVLIPAFPSDIELTNTKSE